MAVTVKDWMSPFQNKTTPATIPPIWVRTRRCRTTCLDTRQMMHVFLDYMSLKKATERKVRVQTFRMPGMTWMNLNRARHHN